MIEARTIGGREAASIENNLVKNRNRMIAGHRPGDKALFRGDIVEFMDSHASWPGEKGLTFVVYDRKEFVIWQGVRPTELTWQEEK